MSHERGGRVREQAEAEAKARLERERARLEQLHNDLRQLLPLAAFQRYQQHLAVKCGTFDSVELLTSEAYRIQARRAVGMEIVKEMGDADRQRAAVLFSQMLFQVLEPPPKEPIA